MVLDSVPLQTDKGDMSFLDAVKGDMALGFLQMHTLEKDGICFHVQMHVEADPVLTRTSQVRTKIRLPLKISQCPANFFLHADTLRCTSCDTGDAYEQSLHSFIQKSCCSPWSSKRKHIDSS